MLFGTTRSIENKWVLLKNIRVQNKEVTEDILS